MLDYYGHEYQLDREDLIIAKVRVEKKIEGYDAYIVVGALDAPYSRPLIVAGFASRNGIEEFTLVENNSLTEDGEVMNFVCNAIPRFYFDVLLLPGEDEIHYKRWVEVSIYKSVGQRPPVRPEFSEKMEAHLRATEVLRRDAMAILEADLEDEAGYFNPMPKLRGWE